MLVVMSITVLFSTILIGYARESGRQMLLISSQAKVINLISRAKSLSIATFIDEGGLPANSGTPKICGYGVHVDVNLPVKQVFIFRDSAVDCYDPTSANYRVFGDGGLDAKLLSNLDVFSIPDTIKFGADTDLRDVLFIPPDPIIVINGDSSLQSAKITLQNKDNSTLNASVKIDNAGKISTK
jgi:hypothetical protein